MKNASFVLENAAVIIKQGNLLQWKLSCTIITRWRYFSMCRFVWWLCFRLLFIYGQESNDSLSSDSMLTWTLIKLSAQVTVCSESHREFIRKYFCGTFLRNESKHYLYVTVKSNVCMCCTTLWTKLWSEESLIRCWSCQNAQMPLIMQDLTSEKGKHVILIANGRLRTFLKVQSKKNTILKS